ncbi:ribonuclease HII [bacterium]|nr:ribonuclease HII [bacterium]
MKRRLPKLEVPKYPDLRFEIPLWQSGLTAVAGLDEAGRGAWAGPVAAGAVILPAGAVADDLLERLHGVRDSKVMTSRQRGVWAEQIRLEALAWGVGFAECDEVDTLGIVPATRLAMERALAACKRSVEHLLVDAVRLPGINLPQQALIKGDARSLSIAAASVLAKTARDAVMIEMEETYPGYGFAMNKGYGTAVHRAGLDEIGPCPMHRFSFAPVKERSERLGLQG